MMRNRIRTGTKADHEKHINVSRANLQIGANNAQAIFNLQGSLSDSPRTRANRAEAVHELLVAERAGIFPQPEEVAKIEAEVAAQFGAFNFESVGR